MKILIVILSSINEAIKIAPNDLFRNFSYAEVSDSTRITSYEALRESVDSLRDYRILVLEESAGNKGCFPFIIECEAGIVDQSLNAISFPLKKLAYIPYTAISSLNFSFEIGTTTARSFKLNQFNDWSGVHSVLIDDKLYNNLPRENIKIVSDFLGGAWEHRKTPFDDTWIDQQDVIPISFRKLFVDGVLPPTAPLTDLEWMANVLGLSWAARLKIPANITAPIEPEFIGAKLMMHHEPLDLGEVGKDQLTEKGWKSQKQFIDLLISRLENVQNTILRGSLEIYRQALGEHYVDVDPILLGSAGTVINLLSSVVDEELLEIEAAAIKGLSANHGLLIRRFPQWQLYLDDIRGNDVEASAASASFDSVRKIVEATQLVGFVDNNIPRTLAILDDASSRKPNGDNSVVTSLFRSVSNVVARVAQRALQDFVKELRPTGIKLVTGATYGAAWEFIKGISHSLSDLAVKIPNLFEWVRPVLQVLGLL